MAIAALGASVESLLQEMVRIDTVSDQVSGRVFSERPLAERLEQVAQAEGFKTRRLPIDNVRYNLLVTYETDSAKPWLMFESHLDTVAVEGMTVDPFGGEIRDGRLWGRGSCDTKGTGAAMLWALSEYVRQGAQPNNIAILFALDEELGMSGIRAFAQRQYPNLGFKVEGVIVGEPTRHTPIVAHNGGLRWLITTSGVAAHSSTPWLGKSAISAMVKVIQALETEYAATVTATHPQTGASAFSVNVIRGGSAANVIPDSCTITVDRRIVPGEDPATVQRDFHAFLDSLAVKDPNLATNSEKVIFAAPPLEPTINQKFITLVQGALAACNLPTETYGKPYATDAGDLSQQYIPAVVLGPGDIAQAHTKDEFIELEQLYQGVEVYRAIMNQPPAG